jgi:translation elongation factor EF-Tu-like GTPase
MRMTFAAIAIAAALLSMTCAEDQAAGAAAPKAQKEDAGTTIVVSAPDGPTLATRDALRDAQQGRITVITLKLENLGLIQDEALVQLITDELYAIANEYGYDQGEVSLIKCSAACD